MAKRSARERLRGHLSCRSKIHPRLLELQEQTSWIASVGTVDGLIAWLEAREELGLLDSEQLRYARNVVLAAVALINEHLDAQLPPEPPRRPWAEQLALINERESARRAAERPTGYHVKPKPKPKPKPRVRRRTPSPPPASERQSLMDRMAAAWKRLGRAS